ncbi:hypothetical protein [Chryseobacterium sp. BIGb0232]|uniref:hypothetical protein n=1 Tax=Chryseobacterium sp. BIGb0232 TaxID=2940598 RepID=UPI000F492600|nr:hypothetical protein [Chryseobacterium sp. BIGb0232]MCS4301037.1 hypothetical protein [Chryseobacterium sp. BIGb0232]ROS20098.1 hypothetical protein EDF65_0800 [Chryseobacterium nakagawai]
MNGKDTIERVLFYHLDIDIFDNEEEYSLLRAVMYKDKAKPGEEYYNGEWYPFKGALSYYPDPTPGEFIDEARAKEIMKIIDQEII